MDNSSIQVAPDPETAKAPDEQASSTLSKDDELWLKNHLEQIRKAITVEALRVAKENGRKRPAPLDVAEAARAFAPGDTFPIEPKFIPRIAASLSGVTVVSAALAVIFGFLGIWLSRHGAEASNTGAYFDIAKIFAGAVVGSTGAGFVIGARRK
jgi:hypothetical protein